MSSCSRSRLRVWAVPIYKWSSDERGSGELWVTYTIRGRGEVRGLGRRGSWRASFDGKWKIPIPIARFRHSGSIVAGVYCQVPGCAGVPGALRVLCGFSSHDDRSESSRYVSRTCGTRWDEARGIAVVGMRPLKREPVMSKGCHWVPPGAIKQGFGALAR